MRRITDVGRFYVSLSPGPWGELLSHGIQQSGLACSAKPENASTVGFPARCGHSHKMVQESRYQRSGKFRHPGPQILVNPQVAPQGVFHPSVSADLQPRSFSTDRNPPPPPSPAFTGSFDLHTRGGMVHAARRVLDLPDDLH